MTPFLLQYWLWWGWGGQWW